MPAPYESYPGAHPLAKADAYLHATTPAYQLAPAWQQSMMARDLVIASTATDAQNAANTALGRLKAHLGGEDFRRLVTDAFDEDADAVRTLFADAATELKTASPELKKTKEAEAKDASATVAASASTAELLRAVGATSGRNELEQFHNYLLATVKGFGQHDRYRQIQAAAAFRRGLSRGGEQSARAAMVLALGGGAP